MSGFPLLADPGHSTVVGRRDFWPGVGVHLEHLFKTVGNIVFATIQQGQTVHISINPLKFSPRQSNVMATTESQRPDTIKIAVEGCCHGELDKIYETVQHIEETQNIKVSFSESQC